MKKISTLILLMAVSLQHQQIIPMLNYEYTEESTNKSEESYNSCETDLFVPDSKITYKPMEIIDPIFLIQDAIKIIESDNIKKSKISRLQNEFTSLKRYYHENISKLSNDSLKESNKEIHTKIIKEIKLIENLLTELNQTERILYQIFEELKTTSKIKNNPFKLT